MYDGELAEHGVDYPPDCSFSNSSKICSEDQEGCVGIRIYFAKTESDEITLVLAGVKNNGDDMYDGELAEHAIPCPPLCSSSNSLNS